MNKSLSIPEWHRMALEGAAPPVRILLNGGSMSPLIRWNKDYVTIIPPDRELVPGDIVLFVSPDGGRYAVHRVWEIQDGQVLTWGDSCEKPDGWFPNEAIWGRVVLIERGQREISPDPTRGFRWAKFWHKAGKVYRLYHGYRAAIARRIKKLLGEVSGEDQSGRHPKI